MDPRLMAKARRELARDAAAHRKRRAALLEQFYAGEPRLEEMDERIRRVFLDALSNPVPGAMEKAAGESLELQRERVAILASMGLPPDFLQDSPLCPVCGDSGYAEKEPCGCLLERCRSLQTAELSSLLDLGGQTFESFNAERFSEAVDFKQNGSPRQNMEDIRDLCYNLCRKFDKWSRNLLFSGPPGTGKTFLSACVAGAISDRGFSVVYDTAVRQLAQMESQRFGRGGEDAEATAERLKMCDLLIIDDLGAEFIGPFAQSALLDLVNTRLVAGKKILISTNLGRADVRARYSPALASRLEGEFLWLDFFGEDLRLKR